MVRVDSWRVYVFRGVNDTVLCLDGTVRMVSTMIQIVKERKDVKAGDPRDKQHSRQVLATLRRQTNSHDEPIPP